MHAQMHAHGDGSFKMGFAFVGEFGFVRGEGWHSQERQGTKGRSKGFHGNTFLCTRARWALLEKDTPEWERLFPDFGRQKSGRGEGDRCRAGRALLEGS